MLISRCTRPTPTTAAVSVLRARFDSIFRRRTGFATLDRLLARLHANKAELLMVLERPEIPLHTNGSENDIRCQVTRRKVSAGTRSDLGGIAACLAGPRQDLRQTRRGVLGLSRQRLKVPGHTIVRLWRNSSDAAGSQPDTGCCPEFCRYYRPAPL